MYFKQGLQVYRGSRVAPACKVLLLALGLLTFAEKLARNPEPGPSACNFCKDSANVADRTTPHFSGCPANFKHVSDHHYQYLRCSHWGTASAVHGAGDAWRSSSAQQQKWKAPTAASGSEVFWSAWVCSAIVLSSGIARGQNCARRHAGLEHIPTIDSFFCPTHLVLWLHMEEVKHWTSPNLRLCLGPESPPKCAVLSAWFAFDPPSPTGTSPSLSCRTVAGMCWVVLRWINAETQHRAASIAFSAQAFAAIVLRDALQLLPAW